MDPIVGTDTATATATGTKVLSPTVEQDLKARGVAQVIVVLHQDVGAASADSSAARTVQSCFRLSERSQASALRTSLVTRGGLAAARVPPESPGRIFPNLGIMLGTVDRDGLAALQASDTVTAISGSPQISLIRPDRAASVVKPTADVTWGIKALGAPALWRQGLTGRGVKVAHLDTGVDGRHPALKGAVAEFAEFEPVVGRRKKPDPSPYDSGDHGTHTAATIAGRPVAGKHIGVAYGAALHSALVIEGGNVVARVLGGLDWAIGTGARIVSMSLGFRGWWEDFIPIIQILRQHGVLPVIAVGNEGPGTSRSPGNYPSALSVGAADRLAAIPDFSSSQSFTRDDDPLVPDLVAPGVDVISAQPRKRYQSMDGSSMATPHVAGLAALLWEARPDAAAHDIEQAIFASCRRAGSMSENRANRGMPDGVAAFTRLTGVPLAAAPKRVAVPGTGGAKPKTKRAAPASRVKRTGKPAVKRRQTAGKKKTAKS